MHDHDAKYGPGPTDYGRKIERDEIGELKLKLAATEARAEAAESLLAKNEGRAKVIIDDALASTLNEAQAEIVRLNGVCEALEKTILDLTSHRKSCDKEREQYGVLFIKACTEIAELINQANDDKRKALNLSRLTSASVIARFLATVEETSKPVAEEVQHDYIAATDPEDQIFEIWSEGYACTGESSRAIHFGRCFGKTFKEACIKFFSYRDDKSCFDPERMTFWACRLYDNEEDARRSFG